MSQAFKVSIGGSGAGVETLTGNTGGAVGPTGGNIDVVGDGVFLTVDGDPGTSTLTISSLTEEIATLQTTDGILTTIYSFPVPANYAVNLQVQVIGAKSDYSAGVSGTINIGAINDGGGLQIIDSSQDNIITTQVIPAPVTTATATGGNVGDDIAIFVRGVASETWNWRVIVARNVLNI